MVGSDDNSATRFVVAAPGKKFAASTKALAALGYGSVTALKLPAQWLRILPSGPALDTGADRAAGSRRFLRGRIGRHGTYA